MRAAAGAGGRNRRALLNGCLDRPHVSSRLGAGDLATASPRNPWPESRRRQDRLPGDGVSASPPSRGRRAGRTSPSRARRRRSRSSTPPRPRSGRRPPPRRGPSGAPPRPTRCSRRTGTPAPGARPVLLRLRLRLLPRAAPQDRALGRPPGAASLRLPRPERRPGLASGRAAAAVLVAVPAPAGGSAGGSGTGRCRRLLGGVETARRLEDPAAHSAALAFFPWSRHCGSGGCCWLDTG